MSSILSNVLSYLQNIHCKKQSHFWHEEQNSEVMPVVAETISICSNKLILYIYFLVTFIGLVK
jgi:hypothetical protein